MRFRAPLLLLLLVATAVRAHDTWLLPEKFQLPVAARVPVALTSGMSFPKPETAIAVDRIAEGGCRIAGKVTGLGDARREATALHMTARPVVPGCAVLWVRLKPRPIELTEDKVAHYLDEIAAPESVRKAWEQTPAPRRWREVYTKHAKTYVRHGGSGGREDWNLRVGLGLEIVPDDDPTRLSPRDRLTVRVLWQGKPLRDFALSAVAEGAEPVVRTTDAQGRVTFRLDRAGRWLLRGTHLRPVKRDDADWESDFTTLTFEVRR